MCAYVLVRSWEHTTKGKIPVLTHTGGARLDRNTPTDPKEHVC